MAYRIQKLLVISIVLEKQNLISFGGKPNKTDIPQCLVYLQNKINLLKPKFKLLKKEYIKIIFRFLFELHLG